MKVVLAVTAVAAMLCGTAYAPALAGEDANAIVKQLTAQFDKMINSHNAEGVADLFTADAILLPASAPGGVGRYNVLKFFAAQVDGVSNHVIGPSFTNQIADNVIVAGNHWSTDFADHAGKVTHLHGDEALTYEKVGSEWKIKSMSYNTLPDSK